jgi:hypothetical protein
MEAMFNTADEKKLSDLLNKIFMPILLLLGLFGNIISIIIFNQPSMKKYTTFQYLKLISILDLITLYIGCVSLMFISYFNIDIRLLNDFSCKFHSFLVYFFTHLSSFMMAFMSIERAITVMLNAKSSKCFNISSVLKTFIIVCLLIFAVNAHFIFFIKLVEYSDVSIDFSFSNYSKINSSQDYYLLTNKTIRHLNTISLNESNFSILNESIDFLNLKIKNQQNFQVDEHLEYQRLTNREVNNNETESLKAICHDSPDTTYYHFLIQYFPW